MALRKRNQFGVRERQRQAEAPVSRRRLYSSRGERPLLAEGFDLVLDLRGLTFMDSSGLRAILQLHHAAGTSHRLEIIDGPDRVQRLFTITGLRRLLQFASATDAPRNHLI